MFAWWSPYVLKKLNCILAKIKSKYWFWTHKCSIEIPKNENRAKEIDKFIQTTFWWDAIIKETKNVRPDSEEWEGTASEIDAAYQKVTCHMIFDVKMLDSDGLFRRMERYVAGSYTTETPAALTYASAVSQYLVPIEITLVALN